MPGLRTKYITKPERIYVNPLHPATSDYDVVIPQTTSDAVIIEGMGMDLTTYLRDVGSVKVEQRNTIISGSNIVRITGNTVEVGNYAVTVANGFNNRGIPQDVIYYTDTYTTVPTPTSTDNYLIVLEDGTLDYCTYFYGGRDFPANPVLGQIYFNDQLRCSYQYDGSDWVAYPCTAIARFENGELAEILPYNTWWWDEVLWEETEPDLPAGMQVSVYEDLNNQHFLRVKAGGVIDNGHLFTLKTDIYKKVQLPFSAGQEGGSGDGNYTNVMINIIPTDIESTNLQGFSISGDNYNEIFLALNPNINPQYPRWQANGVPAQFTVTFPAPKSINKYMITSYADGQVVDRVVNSWTLLGSNDGVNWDVIDDVSNAGFSDVGETKSFHPTNVKQYNSIKFIAKGTVLNSDGYNSLGQIRFYSSVPELNVFVITDDQGNTDVLTSPYSGPTLPMGYTYYHRIGKICIGEFAELFGAFPSTSISIDAAGKYEYISEEVNKRANSSLNNINSDATKLVATLVAPKLDDIHRTNISNQVTYKADVSGYIHVYNTTNATLIYNNNDIYKVSGSWAEALVGGAPVGVPCSAYVSKGSYYMVNSTAADFIKFTPAVGSVL